MKSNEIIVYKCKYDLRQIGIVNLVLQEEISNISYPNKSIKVQKLKELHIKFNNYIVTDNSILNFGQKFDDFETYYVIKGFFENEDIYLKTDLDIKKLISTLKY